MPETLPSGRPSYWRFLVARPEGVYVWGTNVRAETIARRLTQDGASFAQVKSEHPALDLEDLRACLCWAADQAEATKETEANTHVAE